MRELDFSSEDRHRALTDIAVLRARLAIWDAGESRLAAPVLAGAEGVITKGLDKGSRDRALSRASIAAAMLVLDPKRIEPGAFLADRVRELASWVLKVMASEEVAEDGTDRDR
ncbi:MAG: hypothetical protein E7L00_04695 [Propionibacteriaceae bacterium]|nr:hypothetical protein [Propionibacteriaceae bacterium]